MNLLKLKFLLLLLITALVTSCDVSDDTQTCISTVYAPATEVTGPATATVNQDVTYVVKYKIENSCGAFLNFAKNETLPLQIAVVARYSGCNCNEVARIETRNYIYKPATAGEHTIKFFSGNGLFISKTLTVN